MKTTTAAGIGDLIVVLEEAGKGRVRVCAGIRAARLLLP
jgi:hypothetical protein